MGRRVKKNLLFIVILAIGIVIIGSIIVVTGCSVEMLDYIEEKITLDEADDEGVLIRLHTMTLALQTSVCLK